MLCPTKNPFINDCCRYEYGVGEKEVGLKFGQQEERAGRVTTGQYSVALPDGRHQTVTYRCRHVRVKKCREALGLLQNYLLTHRSTICF